MSVANILFSEDRILCLSDTMIYNDGQPVALCESKTHTHPSGRFAMVTRGLCHVGDALEGWIADQAGDINEAESAAATVLNLAAEVKATKRSDLRVELTLMGWSPRHKNLRVVQFRLLKSRPEWDVLVLDRGLYLHPDPGAPIPPPTRDPEGAMVKLALAQRAVLDKRGYRDMCVGGVMHLTTITEAGITQRIAGVYPGYDADAARFEDPNAAAVAAFRQQAGIAA